MRRTRSCHRSWPAWPEYPHMCTADVDFPWTPRWSWTGWLENETHCRKLRHTIMHGNVRKLLTQKPAEWCLWFFCGLSIPMHRLIKLGRCDSYIIEWLNNRTYRLLVLIGIQAQSAKIHLAPFGTTWLHLAPLGTTWHHLAPLGTTGSIWVHLGPPASTWVHTPW